jgi:hypothetical protein
VNKRETLGDKRQSMTMAAAKKINLPDVLGGLTGGIWLNIDYLQTGATLSSAEIKAGMPFNVLLLLQNACNSDMDVVVKVHVPQADSVGKRGRFTTPNAKPVRIGLRPAEVGIARLPVQSAPETAPGKYTLQVEIVAETKQRSPSRVRSENGGSVWLVEELPGDRQPLARALQTLRYTNAVVGKPSGNKATLAVPLPLQAASPGTSSQYQPAKLGYDTLWTTADNIDEAKLFNDVAYQAQSTLSLLNANVIFMPLLRVVQQAFERSGFRLQIGEAVAIAKMMAYVLGIGAQSMVVTGGYPRWYSKLCHLLQQDPFAGRDLERLITDLLFYELVQDAVMIGYPIIEMVTGRKFAPEAAVMAQQAAALAAALHGKGSRPDIQRVYMPLVLGGIAVNHRVVLPNENRLETTKLFTQARQSRDDDISRETKHLLELADSFIKQAAAAE